MAGQIKVRECVVGAISPLFRCWIAGPLPIGTVLLRRCGDERDGLLPTRRLFRDVPYVTRRPYPLAGDSLGLVSGGGVSRIVKTASSRGRTGRTLFERGDCCSPQARLAERRNAADRRSPPLRYHTTGCYTGHQAGKPLMLSRWGTADALVERMGARPNRAVVVKTALTCVCWTHNSTVLERRPGRMKIYLVTMSARCSVPGR